MEKTSSKLLFNNENLPQVTQTLTSIEKKKYKLTNLLGKGGYGLVFKCTDENNNKYALKVENLYQTALNIEIYVLKSIAGKKCTHFCRLIDSGKSSNFMFIVMTLLGRDLSYLRNNMPFRHFTLGTALRVGMQTAKALHELHSCRFISRDVKPSNFVTGLNASRINIYMIDFGLVRKYMNRNFKILPPRTGVGWRGTIRYGSLRAHCKKELCRKDDFESWIYMMIEFTKGSLPWRTMNDKNKVYNAKLFARTQGRKELFHQCPKVYNELLKINDNLNYETEPPYKKIYDILYQCCINNNIDLRSKYDWENESHESTTIKSNESSIKNKM